MSKKNLLRLIILIFLIIGFSALIVGQVERRTINIGVVLTFAINIVSSVIMFVAAVKKHSFSFEVMFWMFSLVFLGIAPLTQYLANWSPWGLVVIENELISCNLLILLWHFTFWAGSRAKVVFTLNKNHSNKQDRVLYYENKIGICVVTIIAIIFCILLIRVTGIFALFFKGQSRLSSFSDLSSVSLLVYHVFRNTILYALVIQLLYRGEKGKNKVVLLVIAILFLVTCFPTGLSRYMAAAFYVGIIIFLLKKERCGIWFSITIFLGLTIVFPIMNVFRRITGFYDWKTFTSLAGQSLAGTYLTGNYDAHNMIISGFHYIEKFGFSSGRQLLGAALFFVPRILWAQKPIGSGSLVVRQLGQSSFTNVSMPLVGEAYLNFGVIGVIFFGLLIGYISSRVDKRYWTNNDKWTTINIVYPFAMFYFFFLQRGDMLSAGSFMIANCVVGWIISKVCTKRKKQ